MEHRAAKDAIYDALAEVTRALASPRRLEILDRLAQRAHRVDDLAAAIAQSVANTSQHLQVLARSRLVERDRHGRAVEYRLAPGVAELFAAVRRVAAQQSAELQRAQQQLHPQAPSPIPRAELQARLAQGRAALIDVRPRAEFAAAHIPGATSIPIEELPDRVHEVPADRLVVAVCRGPYCSYATRALPILRDAGRDATWFDHGVAEWAADGGELVAGGAS